VIVNRKKRVPNRESTKRIVHLARRYTPMVGGVEKHLEEINQEFLSRGYQVSVIAEQTEPSLTKNETCAGVEVYRLPINAEKASKSFINKLTFKIKIWLSLWQIRSVWMEADKIQIHDVFFWMLPFLHFVRKKVYITFHGYEANKLPDRTQRFWHQLASLFTEENLCIGGFHHKWFGVTPGLISFGAVDSDNENSITSTQKLKRLKTPRSEIKIIFIGRLQADTGILQFLQACKILQQNRLQFSLEIFGDGLLKNQIKEFVKTNELKIKVHGFVPQAHQLIPQFDFVFASQYLVILESLAAAKPVIAYTDTQFKNDYLSNTPFASFITIAKNPQEIVKAVEASHSKAKLESAQIWARQQTWSKLADNYESLWYETK
jgi:glycosyltransferase involved in cell wall biosynthesis